MAGLGEPQRDELPPDRDIGKSTRGEGGEPSGRIGRDRDADLEKRLLRLSTAICTGVSSNALGTRRSEWSRGYRAYNNQHLETSKYRTNTYRTRAKNYVPKTRQAVKKNLVAGASSLFGASDVISVTAENDSDPEQQASALINQELLNYRLDRTNFKAGISWFPICMMQLQTTRITGICFSKQYWEYEEILVPATPEDLAPPPPPEPPPEAAPSPDAGAPPGGMLPPPGMPPGLPPPDQMGGAPPGPPAEGMPPDMGGGPSAGMPPAPGGDMMGGMGPPGSAGSPPGPPPAPTEAPGPGGPMPPEQAPMEPPQEELQEPAAEEQQEPPEMPEIVVGMDGQPMVARVLRDRPRVRPFPPEQAIIDLSAPAEDVVQEGDFFIMQMPMRISQIRVMQQKGRQTMGGGPWLDVPEARLKKATEEYTSTSVRSSRGRGTDPQSTLNQPAISDLDIVWVHENFIKVDGTDFHFYSLSHDTLLSQPGPTDEHYPKHQGERPYVMGLGEIEAFSPIPMSMVESIQPLQNEINDIRNLALDTLKQGIAPIGVYRRGTDIDLRALKERGPDANIGVGNMDDLRFEKVPGPDPISFNMHDRLTIEIDESAGSFSTSSVNNNRAAGETVGGLNLISNAANSTQEYDLRVFVETYVERVLRQLIMLEQGYETDEHILAVVGQKANVFQRFGVSKPIDELLVAQVTTKVNCGVGATDPMMKLQKFSGALQMAATVAEFVPGQVQPKAEEIYSEIFASAGYKAERFFTFTSPEEVAQQQQEQPDPQAMLAEAEVKKADAETQKLGVEVQKLQLETARFEEETNENRARFGMEMAQAKQEMQVQDRQFELERTTADRDHELALKQHEATQHAGLRDHQLARDQFDHTQESAAAEQALAREQFDHSQESGQRDFSLKAAGQNQQLIDAATAEAMKVMTPQQAREPLPVETAMTDTMTQLQQIMQQVGQSIQTLVDGQTQGQQLAAQGQQMLQQMLQGQSQAQTTLDMMLQQMQAKDEMRRRVRQGMGMPIPQDESPEHEAAETPAEETVEPPDEEEF